MSTQPSTSIQLAKKAPLLYNDTTSNFATNMRLRVIQLGIFLAFSAWLMQLSVFLTPILSKEIVIGHGVCVELAAMTPMKQRVHTLAMMPDDMSMPNMRDIDMQQSSIKHQTIITPKNSTKENLPTPHQNPVQCGFCLLFGHPILPPEILLLLFILLFLAIVPIQQPFYFLTQLKISNKNIRPQGRAPPIFVFA